METVSIQQIWPGWEIVRRIGGGSYGVVYEAIKRDGYVESRAAIKVIHIPRDESEMDLLRSDGLSLDASATYMQKVVDDFVNEIKLMESLKGVQNIVSIEDHQVVKKQQGIGWTIYIRMELLTPLGEYFANRQPNEAEVVKLGIDMCSALERCAELNIIHRDIKPDNIFVNRFGDYKLGDFGVARKLENMTGGMSQKGAPNYMAPEIAGGRPYDTRADLYSLGLVMYRYLNGNRLPFIYSEQQMQNPNEREAAVKRRLNGEPIQPPCNASVNMASLILCACSPDPNNRFVSAGAMKNALKSMTSGNETIAVRRAPAENKNSVRDYNRAMPDPKLHRFGPVNLTLLIVSVVILAGVISLLIWRPWKDPDDSQTETQAAESQTAGITTGEAETESGETAATQAEEDDGTKEAVAETEGSKERQDRGNSPGAALPDIPQSFAATVLEPTLVNISWMPVSNADGYEVEYFDAEKMVWAADRNYYSGTSYVSTLLTDQEEYRYRVRSVNAAGASDWAVLSFDRPLPAAPTITVQPQNWYGEYGEYPDITVVAEGESLTYRWYYRDAGKDDFIKSDETDNVYDSFPLTYARKGREVYCLITDKNGQTVTTRTAIMDLSPSAEYTGPVIIRQPQDWQGKIGQHPSVTIVATGKDITYTWYYQNTNMKKPKAGDDHDNVYDIAEMTAEKNGRVVYCVVEDAYGCFVESSKATLTVNLPDNAGPVIISQPENWYGDLGETPKITVIAEGVNLKYQWYYRDRGKKSFKVSEDQDNSYDSKILTENRAGRELYCVITDGYGVSIKTDTVVMDLKQ